MPEIELMSLDVLPPKCTIEAEMATNGSELVVRFRATKYRRFLPSLKSDWSGWFSIEDEPIALTWATFWTTED